MQHICMDDPHYFDGQLSMDYFGRHYIMGFNQNIIIQKYKLNLQMQ